MQLIRIGDVWVCSLCIICRHWVNWIRFDRSRAGCPWIMHPQERKMAAGARHTGMVYMFVICLNSMTGRAYSTWIAYQLIIHIYKWYNQHGCEIRDKQKYKYTRLSIYLDIFYNHENTAHPPLSSPFFLPSPFLTCCAILPTSFGEKGPHLRRWLVTQPLHQTVS